MGPHLHIILIQLVQLQNFAMDLAQGHVLAITTSHLTVNPLPYLKERRDAIYANMVYVIFERFHFYSKSVE
jgi:hypothetical protein